MHLAWSGKIQDDPTYINIRFKKKSLVIFMYGM